MSQFLVFLGVIVLVASLNAPLQAQEAGGELEEKEPRHHPAVFLGATTGEHETNPSLGLEYEYRLSERWGIGLIFEFTFEHEEREFLTGIPVKYHMGPFALLGTVIVERSRERETDEGDSDRTVSPGVRVGAEYGFEVGELELAPNLNLDFTEDTTKLVWGLIISIGL